MNNFIIEEPLHYADALFAVRKFEREYKISSGEFFKRLSEGRGEGLNVEADDLYEWQSYYDFLTRVDAKLAQLLKSAEELTEEDVVYSSVDSGRASKSTTTQKNTQASLANTQLSLAA